MSRKSLPESLRRFGERAWKKKIADPRNDDVEQDVEDQAAEARDIPAPSIFKRLTLRLAVVAATLAGAAGLLCVVWLELALFLSSKGHMDPEGPMEPIICFPLVYASAINLNVTRYESAFPCEYEVTVNDIIEVRGEDEDDRGPPLP